MIASPFGEKFWLSTQLTEQECFRRLEELSSGSWADALGIANFNGQPMATRKWGLVFLWFPEEPYGAELIARIVPRDGTAEIRGRVGSNAWLFLTTVAITVFVLAVLIIGWRNGEVESPAALTLVPLLAAGYYFLKRRSPFGGPLVDFLQELLEAKPIAQRQNDPITRY